MNIILSKYSHQGISAMRRLVYYRFCTTTHFSGRRNSDGNLSGKLLEKQNLRSVLDVFSSQEKDFKNEHYSLACKIIGKTIHYEKSKPEATYKDPTIVKFNEKINQLIPLMNENEICDVLYLLRRQRYTDGRLFNFDIKNLTEKINGFINDDRFSLYNLVSILSSMSTVGMNTFHVTNMLLKRFIDQNHPEYKKSLSVQNGIEIFNGFSQKGYFLTSNEKRLVIEITKQLATSISSEDKTSILINLIRALSKLNIADSDMLPFINKIAERIRNETTFSENDIFAIFDIGQNTHYFPISKIAQDMKKKYFDLITSQKPMHAIDGTFKVLSRLTNWGRNSFITKEQEAALLDYFETEFDSFVKETWQGKSFPKFFRILARENASMIVEAVIENSGDQEKTISSLHWASKYLNVNGHLEEKLVDLQSLYITDLLKLPFLLRDETKLSERLKEFKEQLPQSIRGRLKQNFPLPSIKAFIKDTPTHAQRDIKKLFIQAILNLEQDKFNNLLKKADFLYILINLFKGRSQEINKKIQTSGLKKVFNQRNLSTVIQYFAEGEINLTSNFWGFAKAQNIPTKDIVPFMTYLFLQKSVRNIQHNGEFVHWLKSTLFNTILIDNTLFSLIIEITENCSNPLATKVIFESLVANLVKCTKLERFQVNKFIRLLKREGLLNKHVSKLLLTQFTYLEQDVPVFIGAFIDNNTSFQRVIERNNNVNLGLLETVLLYDIQLWKGLKENIQKFIDKEQFTVKKSKTLLSSIKGPLRKNPEYRTLTDKLITKFFKELQQKDINEAVILIQKLAVISPDIVSKLGLESIKKKLISTSEFHIAEIFIRTLSTLGYTKIVEQFLSTNTNLSNFSKALLIEKLNIKVNDQYGKILLETYIKINTQKEKGVLLRALLLNNHIAAIDNYLKQNTEQTDKVFTNPLTKHYFRSKYLDSKQEESQQIKQAFTGKFPALSKIQELVQKAGLQFQLSPMVGNYQFNFRIGDKYFLVNGPRNFMFVPYKHTSNIKEKFDSNLEIYLRVAKLATGKNILAIPSHGRGLFSILFREVPELLKPLEKKELIDEIENMEEVEVEGEESVGQKEEIDIREAEEEIKEK